MSTLAQDLAAFAVAVRRDGAPAEVLDSCVQRVRDVLGLCVAATGLDSSAAVVGWAADQGGVPAAHAVGVGALLPASRAAFVNGVLAHSLDYDDTHLPSVLHPSASVVPAALAAAEVAGAGGEELVRAVAVGLEVTVRLGMAGYDAELGNSLFFEHGQHATSICGTLGSALAAGMLLGLDEEQLASALGVAASTGSGVLEANRTGGTVKRLHCGFAAGAGVGAAELVQRGITGPPTVLEGRFGFFEAWLHGDRVDLDAVRRDLGVAWSVPGIFFKPYPANHFTHAAVDAGAELRRRGVRPRQVRRIDLGVPAAALRTIGEPIEVKRAPATGYQAQFSGPYAVVAGLLGGSGLEVGTDDYTDELATDPRRRELMALVEVRADARCDEIFPHQFPAVVAAELDDGRTERVEVLTNRGGPARPLSGAELARKFTDNVAPSLGLAAASALAAELGGLRASTDLAGLLARLTPPRGTTTDTEGSD